MSILSRNFLDERENFIAPSCGDLDVSPGRAYTYATMEDYIDDDEIFNHGGNSDPKSQLFANLKEDKNEYVPLGTDRYVQSLVELKDNKVNRPALPVSKKYTIQDRLYQIQSGNHTWLCVSSPKQDFSKGSSELQTKDGLFNGTICNNYKKLDDGSLEMVNKVLLKKQKQVLGHLIKQFGSVILSGKSIISISLPISIFEPKSLLERLADSFAFAPYFLEKGGETKDTLEQFKLALSFYLTTITADLNPEKPFNPILGETFQGIVGGCPVYLEQISHHPPVAAFQMLGKHFTIEGSFEFQAAISANSVKCRKIGHFSVKFKNTGSVVQVQFPVGIMSGTAFGKRTYQCSKKLQVYSFTDSYYAEIDFDKTESASKKRAIAGFFSSHIYKMNTKFAVKMKQELEKQKDAEIKFKEKDHAAEKLDKVEGSWMEGLTINDKQYWSYGNPLPNKLQYVDNPLPSDCNFRSDLLHLRNGDEMKAQDHKVLLEEAQRKDRKLREQCKHKHFK